MTNAPEVPRLGSSTRLESWVGPEEFTEEVIEAAEALRAALAAMPGVAAARFAFDARSGNRSGRSRHRPYLRADVWVRHWWQRRGVRHGAEPELELIESAS